MKKIRAIIIEDDANWLQIIHNILDKEEDISIVQTISNLSDAKKAYDNMKYIDIALIDICLQEKSYAGLEIIEDIQSISKIKTIALTNYEDPYIMLKAYKLGVNDYLTKAEIENLAICIRSVYYLRHSHCVLREEMQRLVREEIKSELLTKAEKKITDLREMGLSISQIASATNKSQSTIKNQFSNLYRKFNVKSFEELIKTMY